MLKYCIKRVQLLRQHGVEPIMVFDGKNLKMKEGTEEDRLKSRQESRKKAF
jgi:exonuclease-1